MTDTAERRRGLPQCRRRDEPIPRPRLKANVKVSASQLIICHWLCHVFTQKAQTSVAGSGDDVPISPGSHEFLEGNCDVNKL